MKVTYKKAVGASGYQIAYKVKGSKTWKYTTSTSLSFSSSLNATLPILPNPFIATLNILFFPPIQNNYYL